MACAAAAMLLPLIGYAQDSLVPSQHALVTNLGQFQDDKNVRQYRELYPALSGANLVYAKCGKELDIADSDQDYLKAKFASVTTAYVKAYEDAYVSATNAAPPQSFLDDVVKALTKRQQDEVDSVALVIRQKGCNDKSLRMFVKYVDALHKQDKDAANAKPVTPAQPYQ
jgi:hypothetical protein